MQFKDAAYEILKEAGQPLHYRVIAARALAAGLLDTAGRTPEATMGALLYTDTLNQNSRFQRGEVSGTFLLKTAPSGTIQQQIENIKVRMCKELRRQLLAIPPQKFEELIRLLLVQMGFEETETTPYANDQGVDVRGVLRSNPLSVVKVAIQVKRWTRNVSSGVVRDLRGSLNLGESEQGLIITSSGFTPAAMKEAQRLGLTPIRLINGDQLVDLLIHYQIGVKVEQYSVPVIDGEYWREILGVTLIENEPPTDRQRRTQRIAPTTITYPLDIQATYRGQIYHAQLISIDGIVRYDDQEYATPSGAAKAITTDWQSVNGWDFWKYLDPETGHWKRITGLRQLNVG